MMALVDVTYMVDGRALLDTEVATAAEKLAVA
jgi:hypothetical protein